MKWTRDIGSSLFGWGLLFLLGAVGVFGAVEGGEVYVGLRVERVEQGVEGGVDYGLRVLEVETAGPADRAGLGKGDVLVKWDEQLLFTPVQLRMLLRTLPGGGRHSVVVRRGVEELVVELELGRRLLEGSEERLTRVVRVRYDVWARGAAWVKQLESLAVLPDDEAGEGREVSGDLARVLANWLETEGTVPEWVVFLQDEGAGESTNVVERVLPVPGVPVVSAGAGGVMEVAGADGVVEVRTRGGRDFVVIRDVQGAVLYEGPMEGEQDAIFLRRLNPAMRRSAEELLNSGGGSDEPLEVELWRWRVPAKFL